MMKASTARWVLYFVLAALVLTHLFQPARGSDWMLAGFLPWDLAYHLLWMGAAGLAVLWMTGPAWPDEPPPRFVEPDEGSPREEGPPR